MSMTIEEVEASVRQCYSSWSQSYYDDYYGQRAAYPPIHRDLLRDILREARVENVLDAGCGPASFLRELLNEDMELYGFDLTPEMVAEGQRVFQSAGFPPERIWQGSVLDPASFRSPAGTNSAGYDATVCAGVLPHIPQEKDQLVIANLRDSVQPGGIVVAEARNELFALFTQNRYSYQFTVDRLIRANQLMAAANGNGKRLAEQLDSLKEQFHMDLPPVRRGTANDPGYDEVLSRTHNPFVLRQQFESAGLSDIEVLFYHYHCLPPMFESDMPEFFRQMSLAMENPRDWRGHFMASAFFITGRRA